MTRPLSEGSGLGLDHSQIPECQVPAVVGLFVAIHSNSHRPLSQKLHKVLRHWKRKLLKEKSRGWRVVPSISSSRSSFFTLAESKTTLHWGSLEAAVAEDELDGVTSGTVNTGSSCPQKWYWQKTKLERWRGRPVAWRIFTWERQRKRMPFKCG